MEERKFDEATARAIFKIAYGSGEINHKTFYIVLESGVFLNEQLRVYSPRDTVLDWTFAYDMDWPNAPNPLTAPVLPIPFTARELAACMLDGPGREIQEALGVCIGNALDEKDLNGFSLRGRWVIDALRDAYELAEKAQIHAGKFDYDESRRANALSKQAEDENRVANTREKVFERGISNDEANQRHARAIASLAELEAQASEARAVAKENWAAWRKRMVYWLLAPEQIVSLTSEVNDTSNASNYDFAMLATRAQLISAFGPFTGMNASWFKQLKNIPALENARKVMGRGIRGATIEPMFCPFEVMQWLVSKKRRKGRALSVEKAWDLLEKHFPRVHSARSVGDPRLTD